MHPAVVHREAQEASVGLIWLAGLLFCLVFWAGVAKLALYLLS